MPIIPREEIIKTVYGRKSNMQGITNGLFRDCSRRNNLCENCKGSVKQKTKAKTLTLKLYFKEEERNKNQVNVLGLWKKEEIDFLFSEVNRQISAELVLRLNQNMGSSLHKC
jgi:hypothetical protein